jgi:site-specific recombinase XerD
MTATTAPTSTDLDLADLLPSWKRALLAERRSPETIRLYGQGVKLYLAWCADTGRAPALGKATVRDFVNHLLDTGRAPATAQAYQNAVRQLSLWLVEEGEQQADPLLGLKPPKQDAQMVPSLTDAELKRLVAACQGPDLLDRRDEAAIRLMAETGLRIAECCALTLNDVDLATGIAIILRGKGGKGRAVSFGPQTGRALDRYLRLRRRHRRANEPALWVGDRGKTCGVVGMRRAMVKRAELAGIQGFHPHVLRHTAASRWLARGGSEGGLMAMAGWSRREMIDRYVATTRAELAAQEARGLHLGDY